MTDRRPLPYDWSDLKARLQAELPRLLARLNLRCDISGRPMGDGRMIYPKNPTRHDRNAGSFVVWLSGGAAGSFKDYALGETFKGDVVELVRVIAGLQRKVDAYWWAVDFLGLPRQGHTDNPRSLTDAAKERQRRDLQRQAEEARQIEDDEAKSAALFKLWLSLRPIEGTPAERYLREVRQIPLERLKELPQALRWAEEVEYENQTTGEVTTWRHVMVSAMTRGKQLTALHRTYLKPDGSGKADLSKAKLMIGPCRGTAIRLSKGPSGLSPTKAAAAGKLSPLAIGEGIETALTVACAKPNYRVWAAGSLSLMGLLDWPDCASAIVLLGENDWKPEARRAFDRVHQHWQRQAKGRPVVVVQSAVGSDFNDWARAG